MKIVLYRTNHMWWYKLLQGTLTNRTSTCSYNRKTENGFTLSSEIARKCIKHMRQNLDNKHSGLWHQGNEKTKESYRDRNFLGLRRLELGLAQLKFIGKVSKKRKASRKSICQIYKEAPLSFAKCRETVETLKGLERKTGRKSPGGLLPQDLPAHSHQHWAEASERCCLLSEIKVKAGERDGLLLEPWGRVKGDFL